MKTPKWKIKGQQLGYPGSGARLADNMKHMTGKVRPANYHAHHIVPSTDPRGKKARDLLKENGIDINEGVQGVYLPQGSKYVDNGQANHKTIHTNAYYDNIRIALKAHKGNPSGMRDELERIKQLLLSNQFPH